MEPARHRAACDDVLTLPEHLVGEIVDGELYASPRPGSPQALAASGIGSDVFGRFNRPPNGPDAPGGWWILYEPEIHLGPDAMVPDVAGWRRERMPAIPNVAYFELAPDWVCEVVSPKTAILDRRRKMPIYACEGVSHLWIADPILKTLEVHRHEGGRWIVARTHGGDEQVRAEPFDAVEIDLARWWLKT
ncbi:Uma2 family endonuclease [Candidatus Binatia bacterium]|nr:Uma2 family endonuclease [Candidatus Binatia bacterium]